MHAQAFAAGYLAQSAAAMTAFAASPAAGLLDQMAVRVAASLRGGGKLLIAGNGGSAADAQHIAGEFVGRLMYDRRPLAALALTTDTSGLTAIANDYGYDQVFARQITALARPGDVFLAISTSGRSPSILRALDAARNAGLACLGFTGQDGGPMRERCDLLLEAPSGSTPIIQQIHITAAHIFCALVERSLCPQPG
ncbi:MAG: D-sedoheptulose 7-phosphate isomerase [Pseudomonadota bacterium]|nr:D-sedoheptulose 7-phosphate isomerase [Pseudomonadota bacterium]